MDAHYVPKPKCIDELTLGIVAIDGWHITTTDTECLKKGDVFAFDIDGTRHYAVCKGVKVSWKNPGMRMGFSYLLERVDDDETLEYLRTVGIEKVIENRKHADKLRQIAKKLQMYDCLKTTAIPEILRLADEYEGVKH